MLFYNMIVKIYFLFDFIDKKCYYDEKSTKQGAFLYGKSTT